MGKRIIALQNTSDITNDTYIPVDSESNGAKKISAGFINNIVTDVTVDNTSVVNNGVAAISLSDKQDVLTPGTNIQIQNNTISATDTTYSNFSGTDGTNAGTSGLVPAPTTSDSNKFLKSDGTWTTISGSSSVVANPSGTSTDTLNTISIDNVIYEIQGGSGGGSGYSETVLNDGTNTNNVYTLSDSMNNYDLLEIEWNYADSYYGSVITSVESFKTSESGVLVKNTDSILFCLQYTSDTSVTRYSISGSLEIRQIKGLKFGGGSANIVELTEYDYVQITPEADTLYLVYENERVLDPNYNYYTYGDNDEIVVRVYHEGESDEEIVWFFHGFSQASGLQPIPSELLPYYKLTTVQSAKSYLTGTSSIDGWVAVSIYQGNHVIGLYNTSYGGYSTNAIDAVIVMGNGAEQNTTYYDPYVYIGGSDPVRKIYYNGRKYLSGGYSENVLYTASDLSFSDITVDWSWSDYDQYIFMVHDALPNVQNGDTTVVTTSQINNFISDGTLQYFYRGGYYAGYTYSNNQITANEHVTILITQIIGIKFG